MDRDNNNFELARFTIHSGLTGNALVPCVLLRHSGHFELRTLAHCTSGRTVRMLREPLGLLLKDLSSGHNKVGELHDTRFVGGTETDRQTDRHRERGWLAVCERVCIASSLCYVACWLSCLPARFDVILVCFVLF